MVPLILILLATASAVLLAYGTQADVAQWSNGLELIMWSRRLQWPLVALSLGLCMALIALVISGRRRAWWLIGLGPVLALFAQRFTTGPASEFVALENPVFIAPDAARAFVSDEDWVVGLEFEGEHYAYPYAALYHTPVVIQSDHDQHLAVFWSAQANRVLAFRASRELKARDLDVVSTPANALLLFNTRLGEFINALTGKTPDGAMPQGLKERLDASRMPWLNWRTLHPQTRVMLPSVPVGDAPRKPIAPTALLPATQDPAAPASMPIVFIESDQPLAIDQEALQAAPPDTLINATSGKIPVLVFRDPETQMVRAFDRRVEADLWPRFRRNADPDRRGAFIDVDTGTAWSGNGVALDGDRKGQRLVPIPVEENLYWGVMKHWYPELTLHRASIQPAE